MNKFSFFHSTSLDGENSLFEQFFDQLQQLKRSPFAVQQVIVPNPALGMWLKKQLTLRYGICSNLDFVVLVGPVIQNIYRENFPQQEIFNFEQASYIIYDLLLAELFAGGDDSLPEIRQYVSVKNSSVDIYKVYQLARQLKDIFAEYLFMRTDELLSGAIWRNDSRIVWQQPLWEKLVAHIHQIENKVLFTDIYHYFLHNMPSKYPSQLFIFGLPTIFPAQLKILTSLSQQLPISWFHLKISNLYYGDLLDYAVRSKLEQKVLGYPYLRLEDLYLMDGNPLVANLAHQSRELTELLLNNFADLDYDDFSSPVTNVTDSNLNALGLIKQDIRNLTQRISPDFRLLINQDYYADPVNVAANDDSIAINICHTRMREVQVAFNVIAGEIAKNGYDFSDILLTAPDIDNYAEYIRAVFGEEYLIDAASENHLKMPINVTGNRNPSFGAVIETIKNLLNFPYQLPVSYLIDIIANSRIMNNLQISEADVELIKKWLLDNNTHFGYDGADYQEFNIGDADLYSLKRLINNLTLGACLPDMVFTDSKLPRFRGNYPVVPYDNLDFSSIALLEKLILVIDLTTDIRRVIYHNQTEYNNFTTQEFCGLVLQIGQILFTNPEEQLEIERFVNKINLQPARQFNLAIINQIIDDYLIIKAKVRLNGAISCTSLTNVRNIPFKVIYILGLNFGEFPRAFDANQMSYLAANWQIGDRNYNLEDKQIFLETILAAKEKLVLSYIGRDDTDNSHKDPSTALSLLIETLKNSFVDGDDYLNSITQLNSLHPFINNHQALFSGLWARVVGVTQNDFTDNRWNNFNPANIPTVISTHLQGFLNPSPTQLISCLSYSNSSINRVLGINKFDNSSDLADCEPLELFSSTIAKQLYPVFSKLDLAVLKKYYDNGELYNQVRYLGIIGNNQLGIEQFNKYYQLYLVYAQYTATDSYNFESQLGRLVINNQMLVKENTMFILSPFSHLSVSSKERKLSLNLKAQYAVWYSVLNHPSTIFRDDENNSIPLHPQLKLIDISFDPEAGSGGSFVANEVAVSILQPENLAVLIEEFYINSLYSRTLMDNKLIVPAVEKLNLGMSEENILEDLFNIISSDFANERFDKYSQDPLWASDFDNLEDNKQSLAPVVAAAKIFAQVIIDE